MRNLYTKLFDVCTLIGFVVIVGASSALESGMVSVGASLLYGFAGLALAFVGSIGLHIADIVK